MSCSNNKEFAVNSCPDNFLVSGLEATKQLTWRLKGKFDQIYEGASTTSAQGVLTIPVGGESVLAKDLFQSFSGAWELRLPDAGTPVKFCALYDYLAIVFERVSPAPDPNNVIIDLDC